MSTQWDAPNQQVVRPDQSAPWEEGTGGSQHEQPSPHRENGDEPASGLDAMTKAELLDRAQALGITPANNDMTKDELKAAIQAAGD